MRATLHKILNFMGAQASMAPIFPTLILIVALIALYLYGGVRTKHIPVTLISSNNPLVD